VHFARGASPLPTEYAKARTRRTLVSI
jgi:hypothetical protein